MGGSEGSPREIRDSSKGTRESVQRPRHARWDWGRTLVVVFHAVRPPRSAKARASRPSSADSGQLRDFPPGSRGSPVLAASTLHEGEQHPGRREKKRAAIRQFSIVVKAMGGRRPAILDMLVSQPRVQDQSTSALATLLGCWPRILLAWSSSTSPAAHDITLTGSLRADPGRPDDGRHRGHRRLRAWSRTTRSKTKASTRRFSRPARSAIDELRIRRVPTLGYRDRADQLSSRVDRRRREGARLEACRSPSRTGCSRRAIEQLEAAADGGQAGRRCSSRSHRMRGRTPLLRSSPAPYLLRPR